MALYRGRGGGVWEMDTPKEGTQQRERFDAQVASGDLVPVDESEAPESLGGSAAFGDYTPVDAKSNQEPAADVDLTDLKVDELKAHAEANGIDLGDATKKADIVAAIEAAGS